MRRDRRRLVTATGACSRRSSRRRRISTRVSAASSPRSLAAPPRARRAGRARCARLERTDAGRGRAGRRDAGAGARRSAARRHLRGQGDRLGAGAAARPRRPSRRARRVALPRARPARAAVHLPARERRAHPAARGATSAGARSGSGRRSTTQRARRSTRARGCSASAIRAGRRSTGSPARGTRTRSTSPSRRVPGLDFSFSGLKTALLYAIRDLGPDETERLKADLAASYQRAIVRALVGGSVRPSSRRARTGRGRRRRRGELGASRDPARGAVRPSRAVHGQRCDDRLVRAVRRAAPAYLATLPSMRTHRSRSVFALTGVALGAPRRRSRRAGTGAAFDDDRRGGLAGSSRRARAGVDRAALRRPAEAAVTCCARQGERWRGDREGDDRMESERRWRSRSSSSRAWRRSARGSRPSIDTRRSSTGFSARLDPTSLALLDDDREVTGVYPGAHRVPGAGGRGTAECSPTAVADLEVAGLDGSGVTVALLDTGVDPSHPYLQGARPLRRRRPEPWERRHRPAASDHPRTARASCDRARRDHRRHGRTGRTSRDRARAPRSCPCVSGAGSRTRRAVTASTPGPTRSSPGSRLPSIPTTTAMPTTPPGSRSSAWSSRTPASLTARSHAGSPERRSSTC